MHSVPTDQVVLINAGNTPQEVLIPRGAYDIETIIAMLNASDALFEIVYSGENAFQVYNQLVIPPLTQLIHSMTKAIHLSRCVGSMKVVGKWRIKRENFFGPFSAIFIPDCHFIPGCLFDHCLLAHLEYHGA